MDSIFLNFFIVFNIIFSFIDVLLAFTGFRHDKPGKYYLASTMIFSACVIVSYIISIFIRDYFWFSLMNAIYFVAIDWCLFFFLSYTIVLTRTITYRIIKKIRTYILGYVILDTMIQLVNPFCELSISYIPRDTVLACFSYDKLFLYNVHLIMSYLILFGITILFLYKYFKVPKEYRNQYMIVIFGIIVIIGVNALFLFIPGGHLYNLLDVSIICYSIVAYFVYYSAFYYTESLLIKDLSKEIVENSAQGILLFDYDDQLILLNQKAKDTLRNFSLEKNSTVHDFVSYADISEDVLKKDNYVFQFRMRKEGHDGIRCDHILLKNSKGERLGHLFTFIDASKETDFLTGFHNLEDFKEFYKLNPERFIPPCLVVQLDTNNLSVINKTFGKDVGDEKIYELSLLMRTYLPGDSYFIRGIDARLIAVTYADIETIENKCSLIREKYSCSFQYATAKTSKELPDLIDTIEVCTQSLNTKKLLDTSSSHSDILVSLIKALEECDPDTEGHVKRTQHMGAELGKRIGLSDLEQSSLSLLCLLHDIGKIGIPLEVLNKPGKLSDEEYALIKTHAEKGYQITQSTREFRGISEMVLHHHERWDGTGYPSGLSKESIPLLSRVISVVDAFDAMVSDRSYRKGRTVSEALNELKRKAGTQFDPYIVSEFVQMVGTEGESAESISDTEEVFKRKENTSESVSNIISNTHIVNYSRYILDDSMRIIETDYNFENITGYTAEDIRSLRIFQIDLLPEEDRADYLILVNEVLARNSVAFTEHRIRRKDGRVQFVMCIGRVFYDPVSKTERSEIFICDTSDTLFVRSLAEQEEGRARKQLQAWQDIYRKDSLTKLLVHGAFKSDLEEKLLSGDYKIMFLMIDVDNFKAYNDNYGHDTGDRILVELANAITASIKSSDLSCRMGGDEFAVALFFKMDDENVTMYRRANEIFTKLNDCLSKIELNLSVSVGVSFSTAETKTFRELYKAADNALYESKNKGKNQITFY